jgi:hypothetical protein
MEGNVSLLQIFLDSGIQYERHNIINKEKYKDEKIGFYLGWKKPTLRHL